MIELFLELSHTCSEEISSRHDNVLETGMSRDHFLISSIKLREQYLKDLDIISSLFFKKALILLFTPVNIKTFQS